MSDRRLLARKFDVLAEELTGFHECVDKTIAIWTHDSPEMYSKCRAGVSYK